MKALIIAAGEGSRLKADGACKFKPLVTLGGMGLIERLIHILDKYGFKEVKVITNEESVEVRDNINSIQTKMNIDLLVKTTPSSLHSLYEVYGSKYLGPVYLFTVDTVFKLEEFESYIKYCESFENADAIMGITSYIDDEKPLYVKLNGENITSFLDDNLNCEFVTGGLYYFRTDIRRYLDTAINSGVHRLRNFLRLLSVNNLQIGAYAFSKIIDVDRLSDIAKAEELIKNENLIK